MIAWLKAWWSGWEVDEEWWEEEFTRYQNSTEHPASTTEKVALGLMFAALFLLLLLTLLYSGGNHP